MTRPPRPKYPSDRLNYHEQRKPGYPAITVVIQAEDAGIVRDSQLQPPDVGVNDHEEPEFDKVEDEPEGTDMFDEETREEADVYNVLCGDSQISPPPLLLILPSEPIRTLHTGSGLDSGGMTHQCLQSLSEEVGLHVPRKQHFFDFQSGKRRGPGWIAAALDLWED
ncbi:hypothetical protein R1sor_022031 [Riccia sorocarpa]|uniref:Uncharacterized protein n=1 Tax=Riccia sorocarpa TaxID=122646 RepID=A0ABD3GM07_9MARC